VNIERRLVQNGFTESFDQDLADLIFGPTLTKPCPNKPPQFDSDV
jgi:hypothetical protein